MVVVEFLLKDFLKECGFSEKQVLNGLTGLGAPAIKSEDRLIVELTPNRPDMFSLEGIIRALNSYYKGIIKKYKTKKKSGLELIVGSVPFRQYAALAVVRNLGFDDQKIKDIIQLQEKLNATVGRKVKKFGIGFYPLQGIDFPIRYVMMEPERIVYQPLNYPNAINANEIVEKHPKGQEYGHLLKGQKKYPVYLDAKDRVMCLIPIVNSAEIGKVNINTKEVLVEVTGVELKAVNDALNIICCSLIDSGGDVETIAINYHSKKFDTPDLSYRKVKLDLEFINKILGVELKKTEVIKLLKKMGYESDGNVVYIPPYRCDVMHIIDIVEDIAIAYGYEKLIPETPKFYSEGRLVEYESTEIKRIMQGMGFLEVKTNILISEEKGVIFSLVGEKTENPASSECAVIRSMLFHSLIDVFVTNKMAGLPQKFYEIGIVYNKKTQEKRLCFGVTDEEIDYSNAKSYLQTLLKECGVDYKIENENVVNFDREKSCKIVVEGKEIGFFGLLAVDIKEKLGLKNDVYLCELCLGGW